MEKAVEQVFTKEIMKQALEHFSLEKVTKKLGSFENYVFEVYHGLKPLILRITHSSHRSKEDIMSELDWMNFLHNEQVNVPKAYESKDGHIVVAIEAEDGSFFYANLFSKAAGQPVKFNDEAFNEKLFFTYGKTVGKMHRATKKYNPGEGIKRRITWEEDDVMDIDAYIPDEEGAVYENAKALIDEIRTLPITKDNFGLIHTDLHSGNFFYDGEDIHTFDFDDCSYHCFCSDIAIPLYYSTLWKLPNESREVRNAFAKTFMKAFMAGYETENEAPDEWTAHLPLFLKLRDLTLYTVFNKKVPVEDRNEKVRAMMEEIRGRLERDEVPILLE